MAFPIRVADVMSSPVETAAPDCTAREAATRCRAASIGSLVVVEDGTVVGIVTSDDFVALLGEVAAPETEPLRAFMSTAVVTIDANATVARAVERMFDEGVARLVVFDGGELVGLVSTDDIVHHVPQVLQRREFEGPTERTHQYTRFQETAYELDGWETQSSGLSDLEVSVGDTVSFTKTISDADVRSFADASGDTNRLHLDDEYAAQTRFGRRIVHGTLVSSLISASLARLPGVTIYLSQTLSFLRPAHVGDRLTAVCEVVERLGEKKYQLTTDVIDGEGERLVEGQAAVLIDETPAIGHVTVEAIATG
ncbi:MAG: CBS domain-containing protein [Halorientalis sp.]